MKRSQRRDFLTVVLFFGILASFLIYLGIGTLLAQDESFWEESGEENRALVGFNSMFYEDEFLTKIVQRLDLKVFHHVENTNILVGREDWLFQIYDEELDYNYLLDYVGGCPYSPEELTAIANKIEERQERFAAMGTEYRLLVIPNAMTVCKDYIPRFVGRQSSETRLRQLAVHMEQEGAEFFLAPIDSMRSDSESIGALYQNTEDAINAYGAYSLYATLTESVECETALSFEEIEFFVHMTEGRKVAKLAGLQDAVFNRTVSVSDRMTDGYEILAEEHCLRSELLARDAGSDSVLMLCFSQSWDRIQMMPFFSETYDTVYYCDGLASIKEAEKHSPEILVEVIHESELNQLLK